jgi:hypothetical protein
MICLRCGYCCINYAVIIVDNPNKGVVENNLILHDGNKTPCRHLQGDKPGEYSCLIHNNPWYKETPCAAHGQIESSPDTPCRMGQYILNLQQKEKQ